MPGKNNKDICAIIMMAGMGTRMKSDLPKVLHRACGKELGKWVLDSCGSAGVSKRVLVVGHGADDVMARFPNEKYVIQKPQNGTGHAVMVGMKEAPKSAKHILILSGDVPCLSHIAIGELVKFHKKSGAMATVLSFIPRDPAGYGRIIRDDSGLVLGIIEEKDLRGSQKEIEECNSGIYVFNRKALDKALKKIKPNERSGEYHLPDTLLYILNTGETVNAVPIVDPMETLGVNTRLELSEASDYLRWGIIESLMAKGVTFIEPGSTWIGPEVKIGKDSIIHPGTIIMGDCRIGSDTEIGPHTEINDTVVGSGCNIRHSVLTECRIDSNVKIGPYAHIRPGTHVRDGAKIGNFVEMKNVDFGKGAKSGHLTYLGDAKIGKNVNIGAGTITCNYDGKHKHKTVIGDSTFIGSNSILVAPIKIGSDCYTAAGSTLSQDVPSRSLAFGRARQHIKRGWVKK
ncbi:bifunctional UDP-N-acetylglucosamine diphosphorylase/glucosamine-1-phosphate N-acetyltransferase GlmU [bacterium]|nr:bifunctional UDP-N-acetylglucosamine diphosphorylase/glucosamine-1-phosphate N-acetyltransferase GlmU [bacterium]